MSAEGRKKKDPNAPVRPWAALMMWLLLNVIWMGVSPVGTPQPVLSEDGGHREFYYMTVPNVMDNTLPLEVSCQVSPTSERYQGVTMKWTLWNMDDKIANDSLGYSDSSYAPVASFGAGIDNDCSRLDQSVTPGEYELRIEFYYENDTKVEHEDVKDVVNTEFHMTYWIYEPLEQTGYIVANILGLVILVTDQAARRWLRRKRLLALSKIPLHKQRHREEWDSLHEQMEGTGGPAVESFQIEMGTGSEEERERLRKQFAEQDEEEEAEVEEEESQDEDGLGEGTTEGLEGEAKVDKDIETVGDLWRRIEEDEI